MKLFALDKYDSNCHIVNDMNSDELSIGELAASAGISRRAVRFYVQQKLIDAPAGLGRGRHYGAHHLDQLRKITQLQTAGHSLEEIRQILAGKQVESGAPQQRRERARPLVSAQLWTRVRVGEGIELNFDARRFSPSGHELARLRDVIRKTFGLPHSKNNNADDNVQPERGGLDASD
jgi:DNA-binding transcriptional MerR regulator